MAACDAYYRDMNAILQPFQNEGKPVMLSSMGSVMSMEITIIENE